MVDAGSIDIADTRSGDVRYGAKAMVEGGGKIRTHICRLGHLLFYQLLPSINHALSKSLTASDRKETGTLRDAREPRSRKN